MANVTIFVSGRIIGYQLSDDDGRTIDRAFQEGGAVTLRLDAGAGCQAQVIAEVAATSSELPAGWQWWRHTRRFQFPEHANDAVRTYPNGWTGLVGLRPGGYFWSLSDRDEAGVSSAKAGSLADAMARCDAEWEAHSGNSS